jgi:cell volume regulation protein A
MRAGALLADRLPDALQAGDTIYLLAGTGDLSTLDRLFTASHLPVRLEDRRFFGELVLDPGADMAELATFYGFRLDPDAPQETVAAFLVRTFKKPVVGDRIRLGHVELVVREMRGKRIVRVGLKLGS